MLIIYTMHRHAYVYVINVYTYVWFEQLRFIVCRLWKHLKKISLQNVLFSGNESFRTDSSSPACNSLSPPVKEESLEGQTSDEGDRDRICSPERSPETPGFRREYTLKHSQKHVSINSAYPIILHITYIILYIYICIKHKIQLNQTINT